MKVEVAYNSEKAGIEIALDRRPNPADLAVLKRLGYNELQVGLTWSSADTPQYRAVAAQVKEFLESGRPLALMRLVPSHSPVREHIDHGQFSYVTITASDDSGQPVTESYILFEPSKPLATAIVEAWAYRRFGSGLRNVTVQNRNFKKEARKLFTAGKILTEEVLRPSEGRKVQVRSISVSTSPPSAMDSGQGNTLTFENWNGANTHLVKLSEHHHGEAYYRVDWDDGERTAGKIMVYGGITPMALSNKLYADHWEMVNSPNATALSRKIGHNILENYELIDPENRLDTPKEGNAEVEEPNIEMSNRSGYPEEKKGTLPQVAEDVAGFGTNEENAAGAETTESGLPARQSTDRVPMRTIILISEYGSEPAAYFTDWSSADEHAGYLAQKAGKGTLHFKVTWADGEEYLDEIPLFFRDFQVSVSKFARMQMQKLANRKGKDPGEEEKEAVTHAKRRLERYQFGDGAEKPKDDRAGADGVFTRASAGKGYEVFVLDRQETVEQHYVGVHLAQNSRGEYHYGLEIRQSFDWGTTVFNPPDTGSPSHATETDALSMAFREAKVWLEIEADNWPTGGIEYRSMYLMIAELVLYALDTWIPIRFQIVRMVEPMTVRVRVPEGTPYFAHLYIYLGRDVRYRYGLTHGKQFGDHNIQDLQEGIPEEGYDTWSKAVQVAVGHLILAIQNMLGEIDQSGFPKEEKKAHLDRVIEAVQEFASKNRFLPDFELAHKNMPIPNGNSSAESDTPGSFDRKTDDEDSRPLPFFLSGEFQQEIDAKHLLKSIEITTDGPIRLPDFSNAFALPTWYLMDRYVRGLYEKGFNEPIHFRAVWVDGSELVDTVQPDGIPDTDRPLNSRAEETVKKFAAMEPPFPDTDTQLKAERCKHILSNCHFGDFGQLGMKFPLANDRDEFTPESAGEHFEKIDIPIPEELGFSATIYIVRGSDGRFRTGLAIDNNIGRKESYQYFPNIRESAFNQRDTALSIAVREINEYIVERGKDAETGGVEAALLMDVARSVEVFAETNGFPVRRVVRSVTVERFAVPIPEDFPYRAFVKIAKWGDGRYRFGLLHGTEIKEDPIEDSQPDQAREGFETSLEAILAAIEQISRNIEIQIENSQVPGQNGGHGEMLQEALNYLRSFAQKVSDLPIAGDAAKDNSPSKKSTAKRSLEEINIPIADGAGYHATIRLKGTKGGSFVYGLHHGKQFGDLKGRDLSPDINGNLFDSRREALETAVADLMVQMAFYLNTKDSGGYDEEEKNERLIQAIESVKDFAGKNWLVPNFDEELAKLQTDGPKGGQGIPEATSEGIDPFEERLGMTSQDFLESVENSIANGEVELAVTQVVELLEAIAEGQLMEHFSMALLLANKKPVKDFLKADPSLGFDHGLYFILSDERFRKALTTSVWDLIPDEFKKTKKVRRVKWSPHPDDKGLQRLVAPFAGKEWFDHPLNGVYFDDKGVTVSNKVQLLFLNTPAGKDIRGIYCMTRPCWKAIKIDRKEGIGLTKKERAYAEKFRRLDFPDTSIAIQHKITAVASPPLEGLHTFLLAHIRSGLARKAQPLRFLMKGALFGIDPELFSECLEALMKLGHKAVDIGFSAADKPIIITPKGNIKKVKKLETDFAVVMPMHFNDRSENLEHGQLYYDLDKGTPLTKGIDDQENPEKPEKKNKKKKAQKNGNGFQYHEQASVLLNFMEYIATDQDKYPDPRTVGFGTFQRFIEQYSPDTGEESMYALWDAYVMQIRGMAQVSEFKEADPEKDLLQMFMDWVQETQEMLPDEVRAVTFEHWLKATEPGLGEDEIISWMKDFDEMMVVYRATMDNGGEPELPPLLSGLAAFVSDELRPIFYREDEDHPENRLKVLNYHFETNRLVKYLLEKFGSFPYPLQLAMFNSISSKFRVNGLHPSAEEGTGAGQIRDWLEGHLRTRQDILEYLLEQVMRQGVGEAVRASAEQRTGRKNHSTESNRQLALIKNAIAMLLGVEANAKGSDRSIVAATRTGLESLLRETAAEEIKELLGAEIQEFMAFQSDIEDGTVKERYVEIMLGLGQGSGILMVEKQEAQERQEKPLPGFPAYLTTREAMGHIPKGSAHAFKVEVPPFQNLDKYYKGFSVEVIIKDGEGHIDWLLDMEGLDNIRRGHIEPIGGDGENVTMHHLRLPEQGLEHYQWSILYGHGNDIDGVRILTSVWAMLMEVHNPAGLAALEISREEFEASRQQQADVTAAFENVADDGFAPYTYTLEELYALVNADPAIKVRLFEFAEANDDREFWADILFFPKPGHGQGNKVYRYPHPILPRDFKDAHLLVNNTPEGFFPAGYNEVQFFDSGRVVDAVHSPMGWLVPETLQEELGEGLQGWELGYRTMLEWALRNGRPVHRRVLKAYPYLEPDVPDEGKDGGAGSSYIDKVVANLQLMYSEGKRPTKKQIEELGREAGAPNLGAAWEAAELSWLLWYRNIYQSPGPFEERLKEMVRFWDRQQPTYAYTDSSKMIYQQYSTSAPIGAIVAQYTGMEKYTAVFEPSAGNGLLVLGASPAHAHVNEIDRARKSSLEFQGFGNITDHNAAVPFPKDWEKQYDIVAANPPFSRWEAPRQEKEQIVRQYFSNQVGLAQHMRLEHVMTGLALRMLKDNGKAAIIIMGHLHFGEDGLIRKYRPFFNWLYRHYIVDDVINMNSYKMYNKQGAIERTMLILVGGRKAVPGQVAPREEEAPYLSEMVDTFQELWERVKPLVGYNLNTIVRQLKIALQ